MQHDLRILLAEDNEINQRLVLLTFKQLGMNCDVASNGQEAVDMHLRHSYDLILMDMHMPVTDGLEATRLIREFEQQQGVKPVYIVALTANTIADKQDSCLDAGMNDIFEKPLRGAKLSELVSRLKN